MGGMGGGMGGMGGGGFRSIPPTGPANATLQPGQTRHLPTRVISLNGPLDNLKVSLPGKGEKLELGDIRDSGADPRFQAALTKLAEAKAPETVAQLVMWNLSAGLDWSTIAKISRRWANPNEVALARAFVARLDRARGEAKSFDSGTLYIDVVAKAAGKDKVAADLRKSLEGKAVLGLAVESGIPAKPAGPGLACRVSLVENDEAIVQVSTTDANGASWVAAGKFTLPLTGEAKSELVADSLAEGMLSRLVRTQLIKGQKAKGKDTFKIHIENASPLVLNGLALSGVNAKADSAPSALAGFSLPPRKSMDLPASQDVVDRLGLKDGVKAIAADLSGL